MAAANPRTRKSYRPATRLSTERRSGSEGSQARHIRQKAPHAVCPLRSPGQHIVRVEGPISGASAGTAPHVSLCAMNCDCLGQRAEGGEHGLDFRITGTQLVTVGPGDREGQFQRVNGIKTESLAEQRSPGSIVTGSIFRSSVFTIRFATSCSDGVRLCIRACSSDSPSHVFTAR